MSKEIREIEPGIVNTVYPWNETIKEELALRLSPHLERMTGLPNGILAYNFWLEDRMKSKEMGREYLPAMMGSRVSDKYITKTDGKSIFFDATYSSENNLCEMLIPCNVPHFQMAIRELDEALAKEGFFVDSSTWKDYEKWEPQMIAKLKQGS